MTSPSRRKPSSNCLAGRSAPEAAFGVTPHATESRVLAAMAAALLSGCGWSVGGQDRASPPASSSRSPAVSELGAVAAIINRSSPQADVLVAYSCGGTLVAPTVIVTAAHCVDGRPAAGIDVIVGGDNLCAPNSIDGERIPVRRVELHPMANDRRAVDVALLHLDHASTAMPMRIATSELADQVSVEAWRHAGPEEVVPCTRRVTHLTTLPTGQCEAAGVTAARPVLDHLHVCAVPRMDSTHNTCVGDSGAGLVSHRDGVPVLTGVVSWGPSCEPDTVGIYMRLSAVDHWITAQTASPGAGQLADLSARPG